MGRRAAREIAMKLLYQLEIQREDREEQVKVVLEQTEMAEKERQYILDIVEGVSSKLSHIDRVIAKYAKGWKLGRMSKVDLSILRVSIYEINFRDDIPLNVSINEAVELAKRYSSEDASAFINGILGKVSKIRVVTLDDNGDI